jgi:hypothetical protein
VEALEKNYRGKRGSKAWVELYQDLFPGSFPIPSPCKRHQLTMQLNN